MSVQWAQGSLFYATQSSVHVVILATEMMMMMMTAKNHHHQQQQHAVIHDLTLASHTAQVGR